MSYVLAVWDGDAPRDDVDAADIFDALCEQYGDTDAGLVAPPTSRIRHYVETLLARWPDIGDGAGVASPWADGPLMNNASGRLFLIGLVWSQVEEGMTFCADVAREQGLICYDTQLQQVLAWPAGS